MNSKGSFERFPEVSGTVREYMMYFIGLGKGEDKEVEIGELTENVPYSQNSVIEDLETLEERGYISTRDEEIYPEKVSGFNDILENTEMSEVSPTSYRVEQKGFDYISDLELMGIEESLQHVFQYE